MNNKFNVGDLICSKTYKPAGLFDLAIVTNIEESPIKGDTSFYYHLYVFDWDAEEIYLSRYSDHFQLIERA